MANRAKSPKKSSPAGGRPLKPTAPPPPDSKGWSSPLEVLKDNRILLIVTGGVAAYKAAELARLFSKNGAQVRVAMTEAAGRFVTPLTFASLTGGLVASDLWERPQIIDPIAHVSWADWAEVLVVAPATANFLAKMAQGLADDFPSAVALASKKPKLLAPAMNTGMYENPATQANLSLLADRGHHVLESPDGLLACGAVGAGRMAEVEIIAFETARILFGGYLTGRKVVVTGGATREPWDDIRFLSNRSSGRMGAALATAAWLMGAETTLIAGPGAATPPAGLSGLKLIRAETTEDMLAAVKANLPGAWALIMNAAPADFRPATRIEGKIKKKGGVPDLALERTPDVLKAISWDKGGAIVVGFAAEDADLEVRAKEKLLSKGLDYIAANKAGGADDAFGSEEISLRLISAEGWAEDIGPTSKFDAACRLISSLKINPS
ncbi:MAG: bifunctional phosphopantothenoylcysteine decarboxylase/phosphopantothenate--cysteine ligase CoaBC [Deltaproteobacteria bacterium]|jgi:phosphopantothenoylcysteine decarboxylase/phosphopantothenate--cysteine ligase|nr:bifunctional phosphopantothenoylcysteine decarboxylase/phosphopantothenate--cysteine ligase CoaBC [Deltaproteobacteria bacterium]